MNTYPVALAGQQGLNEMKTTRGTISSAQIRALRNEAFSAGDALMGFVCDVALGSNYTAAELNDNSCLDHSEQLEIEALDRDAALDRVVAVIQSAEAQPDDEDDEATRRADYEMDEAKDRAIFGDDY